MVKIPTRMIKLVSTTANSVFRIKEVRRAMVSDSSLSSPRSEISVSEGGSRAKVVSVIVSFYLS